MSESSGGGTSGAGSLMSLSRSHGVCASHECSLIACTPVQVGVGVVVPRHLGHPHRPALPGPKAHAVTARPSPRSARVLPAPGATLRLGAEPPLRIRLQQARHQLPRIRGERLGGSGHACGWHADAGCSAPLRLRLPGFDPTGAPPSWLRTAACVAPSSSAAKGDAPVRISTTSTPSAHQSTPGGKKKRKIKGAWG